MHLQLILDEHDVTSPVTLTVKEGREGQLGTIHYDCTLKPLDGQLFEYKSDEITSGPIGTTLFDVMNLWLRHLVVVGQEFKQELPREDVPHSAAAWCGSNVYKLTSLYVELTDDAAPFDNEDLENES